MCSRASDEEVADVGRRSSRTTARLRRTSVPVYGRGNKNNNDDASDDSDSVVSLHRDPLHRGASKLVWRSHRQPASGNRLPNANRNNDNNSGMYSTNNKCIGDDTSAAARQSLHCIKKKIKYGEKRFSISRMEFLHPAMWHVAVESWQWIHQVAAPCNVILGSEMTCNWIHPNVRHIKILHLFSISTHHRSRHIILYQSAKFYPNRTTLGRKKWRHVDF